MVKVIKRLKTIALGLGIISAVALTSCSDDDGPGYSERAMENTELKTILMQQGYTFNEQGALLLDDKVKNTTSLDLSGTGITDFSGLELFPNLTDLNLSNNGYEYSFDFSKLPAQITGVDLTGNELYEFPGLLNIVTKENGDEDVTVLHTLNKLYLPNSAKYNCDEIPTFFGQNVCADMKMANTNGSLEAYNTLREVPDMATRKILMETYPSLFVDNNIDISKRLVVANQSNANIVVNEYVADMSITSVEGIQYVAMNKGYTGTLISLRSNEECEIPYLKLNGYLTSIITTNISTPRIDISKCSRLCTVQMERNHGIKECDLSNCTLLGQRDAEQEFASFDNPSEITLADCPKLEVFKLPTKAKTICTLQLISVNLQSVELSNISTIGNLWLGNMSNCNINYPKGVVLIDNKKNGFGCTQDVYDKESTKTFLKNNFQKLTRIPKYYFNDDEVVNGVRWNNDYK